ncbi:MAG: peptidase BlaR1, partial [Candidatus Solibacter sp.]|nr:peptidase BlaR1 [Candidatus Solibacter sp.]
ELAHIRRYDYLVNLLQVFVEGLVFYHPVVWWIAAVIRAERENCCDDLVVATQGDAFQYASALAALEFNRGAAREPALAATGGSLVKRIRRLLAQPETPRSALTPILSAAILTVTCVAVLAAWQTKPAPQPAPLAAPAPAPAPKPKLVAQAEPAPQPQPQPAETPYHKWLTQDVAYIVTDAERAAFKALPTDAEREHFIEQFWLRRDPTPDTAVNEFKDEHYRRIAYANEKFSTSAGLAGWKTDRGRIYITYGPPDEKETHPSGGEYKRPASEGGGMTKTFPFEQWRYRFIEGVGTNVIIEFVDPTLAGEFRMTMDPNEKDSQFNVQGASVKPHTTVQILGSTAVISVSLREFAAMQQLAHVNRAPNSDAGIAIHGTIFTKAGQQVWTFDDTSKGPALNITRSVPLPIGAYQVKLVITDLASGNALPETVDFEVK